MAGATIETDLYAKLARAQNAIRWVLRVGALMALVKVVTESSLTTDMSPMDVLAVFGVIACLCLTTSPATLVPGLAFTGYLMAVPPSVHQVQSLSFELILYALTLLACVGISTTLWKSRRDEPPSSQSRCGVVDLGAVATGVLAMSAAPLVVPGFAGYAPPGVRAVYTGDSAVLIVAGATLAVGSFLAPFVIVPLRRATFGPAGARNCLATNAGIAAAAGLLASPAVFDGNLMDTMSLLEWLSGPAVGALLAVAVSCISRRRKPADDTCPSDRRASRPPLHRGLANS